MRCGTVQCKSWGTYKKGALDPTSNDTVNADAGALGLINAPSSSVTSTMVGTETVTSSVTNGTPAGCVLLPSPTAVGPVPSPGPGPGDHASPSLPRRGSRRGSGNAPQPALAGVT